MAWSNRYARQNMPFIPGTNQPDYKTWYGSRERQLMEIGRELILVRGTGECMFDALAMQCDFTALELRNIALGQLRNTRAKIVPHIMNATDFEREMKYLHDPNKFASALADHILYALCEVLGFSVMVIREDSSPSFIPPDNAGEFSDDWLVICLTNTNVHFDSSKLTIGLEAAKCKYANTIETHTDESLKIVRKKSDHSLRLSSSSGGSGGNVTLDFIEKTYTGAGEYAALSEQLREYNRRFVEVKCKDINLSFFEAIRLQMNKPNLTAEILRDAAINGYNSNRRFFAKFLSLSDMTEDDADIKIQMLQGFNEWSFDLQELMQLVIQETYFKTVVVLQHMFPPVTVPRRDADIVNYRSIMIIRTDDGYHSTKRISKGKGARALRRPTEPPPPLPSSSGALRTAMVKPLRGVPQEPSSHAQAAQRAALMHQSGFVRSPIPLRPQAGYTAPQSSAFNPQEGPYKPSFNSPTGPYTPSLNPQAEAFKAPTTVPLSPSLRFGNLPSESGGFQGFKAPTTLPLSPPLGFGNNWAPANQTNVLSPALGSQFATTHQPTVPASSQPATTSASPQLMQFKSPPTTSAELTRLQNMRPAPLDFSGISNFETAAQPSSKFGASNVNQPVAPQSGQSERPPLDFSKLKYALTGTPQQKKIHAVAKTTVSKPQGGVTGALTHMPNDPRLRQQVSTAPQEAPIGLAYQQALAAVRPAVTTPKAQNKPKASGNANDNIPQAENVKLAMSPNRKAYQVPVDKLEKAREKLNQILSQKSPQCVGPAKSREKAKKQQRQQSEPPKLRNEANDEELRIFPLQRQLSLDDAKAKDQRHEDECSSIETKNVDE